MKRSIVAAIAAFGLLCAAAAAQTPLISLDVHDVDLSSVIALLADESGVNVVTDGSVKPERITLHLRGVTFDEALHAIAVTHSLAIRREGPVLIVGSVETMNRRGETVVLTLHHAQPEDIAKEIADALPDGTVVIADKRTGSIVVAGDAATVARARGLIGALDTSRFGERVLPRTQAYTLRFLRPDDVVAKLKAVLNEGSFLPDEERNAVLVNGPDHVQAVAQSVIASMDQASPQVMFEVKVADVTPIDDQTNVGLEFDGLQLQSQSAAAGTAYAFTGGTIPVNAQLNTLISKGRASILATPKLVTLNNKEADLSIGETYPIVYSTSAFGGQNVQYVDIGMHLRLTPTIGSDGSVTAELHPEYSELVGLTPSGYPILANRKIDSTLRVSDNQTIVLGGLILDSSSETMSKIPGLSALPLIGKLFQNKQTAHERDEIVFLITPHIIYPGSTPPTQ